MKPYGVSVYSKVGGLCVCRPRVLVLGASHYDLLCGDHKVCAHRVAAYRVDAFAELNNVCFFEFQRLQRCAVAALVKGDLAAFGLVRIAHPLKESVVFGCFNFTLNGAAIKDGRRASGSVGVSAKGVVAMQEVQFVASVNTDC